LARGLATYFYDLGGGVVIDLAGGKTGKQFLSGGSAISSKPTRLGMANRYVNLSSNVNEAGVVFPANVRFQSGATPVPWSVATGILPVAVNATGNVEYFITLGDALSDAYMAIQDDGLGHPFFNFANDVAQPFGTSRLYVAGNYTTLVGSTTSSTTGTIYYFDDRGYFQSTNLTGLVINTLPANLQPCINCFAPSSAGGGSNFDGAILWAGIWQNRIFSQAEARQLADDPWCLLIYPEDEIAATLVGATAAGFTWSETGEALRMLPKGHWLREMVRHD
jgi:hypothetical protein